MDGKDKIARIKVVQESIYDDAAKTLLLKIGRLKLELKEAKQQLTELNSDEIDVESLWENN